MGRGVDWCGGGWTGIAWGLRPAGALFFVFAVTSVGTVSHPPPPALALGVATATAAFCLVLGQLGARYSAQVRPDELVGASAHPMGWADLKWHGLRHLLAALFGGVASLLSPLGHTSWTMVAAVAPISAQDHQGRVQRALHRIVGTLGGVVFSAALLAVPWQPWMLVVWVVALQFLAELFVVRNYSVALLFVTPLALLMAQLAHPAAPAMLLLARAVETVLGALIGLMVVVVVRSPSERGASPP